VPKETKRKGLGAASRDELALKLEGLSKALREGFFEFEGERWPLPKEFLEYKWEVKIKEGKLKFALTFQLEETPPEVPLSRISFKKSPKQIKKQMGALWKSIWRDIRAGNLPSRSQIEALEECFKAYRPFADQSWEAAWEDCYQKVRKLSEALDKGDFALLETLASEILALEKACHRRYK